MVFLRVGRMPWSTNLLKRLVVPGTALPEVHTSPPLSPVLRGCNLIRRLMGEPGGAITCGAVLPVFSAVSQPGKLQFSTANSSASHKGEAASPRSALSYANGFC